MTDERSVKTLSGKVCKLLSDKSKDINDDIPENTVAGRLDMLLADRLSYQSKRGNLLQIRLIINVSFGSADSCFTFTFKVTPTICFKLSKN